MPYFEIFWLFFETGKYPPCWRIEASIINEDENAHERQHEISQEIGPVDLPGGRRKTSAAYVEASHEVECNSGTE
jgi:hypothetical protein